MERKGVFIVLEGADGSGKGTQFNLLTERLKAIGYDVAVFDFPRYDQNSSHFVKQYLNGVYGSAADISPYTASLFYALDRYEASHEIRKALDAGKIVLSNRFTGSNMAHQGGKFTDETEQRGFFVWADNLEYQMLGIPRPDISIFLRVPADVSYELIKRKQARSYTDKSHDEHEADIDHLRKSVATYDLLCRLFPKDFLAIECSKKGRLLGVAEINNLIWGRIKPLLPAEKPNPSRSVVVSLESRVGGDDLPVQPAGGPLSFPFRRVSLWLRLLMEHYSPGSTGPETFDWLRSDHEFYTPRGLSRHLSDEYKSSLGELTARQAALRTRLRQHLEKNLLTQKDSDSRSLEELLMPLTPLAALSSFQINLHKSDIVPLCSHLLAQDASEAQWAAKQLYLAARQKWPKDFKNSLESDRLPEPVNEIIAKLAGDRLSSRHSDSDAVRLLEVHPRREFDLLAESIYPMSSLSLDEIVEEVADWPYQQKFQSLQRAAAVPALLEKVSYKLDLITDQIKLGRIAKAAGVKTVQVQALTPRYGYDVPEVIDSAGLSDIYDDCFDISLQLYSSLQSAGREDLAAYATLMGHKVRWQLQSSAESLRAVVGLSGSADLKSITADIYEKVSEAHPLLWEIIAGQSAPVVKLRSSSKTRVKPSSQRHKRPKKS